MGGIRKAEIYEIAVKHGMHLYPEGKRGLMPTVCLLARYNHSRGRSLLFLAILCVYAKRSPNPIRGSNRLC
jgi:hypothetical protein